MGAVLLVCIVLGFQIVHIYSKYYATRDNKGISIASNLYFNSDKLTKVDKLLDIENATWNTDINWVKEHLLDKIMVYTNNVRWSNGFYDFDILIQNYDSNILYNDAGIDVGYKVDFILLDVPTGAKYEIVDKDNKSVHSLTIGNKVTLEGSLKGGGLDTHTYKIRMTLEDVVDNYKKSRVLAVAYPNSPDYLEKDENQPFLMAGVFAGTASNMEIMIASQNFEVVEEHADFDSKHITYINDLVGYVYNIKTEGDVVKNEETAVKQKVMVKWKSDYLILSEADEYYDESKITSGIENGENYNYIEIYVLPYMSINLTFYKTDKFIQEMKSGGVLYQSARNFKDLVYAYKDEFAGGTP